MKKSLIYSLPALVTTACTNPIAYTPPDQSNCVLHPSEEALQPYYGFLYNNDKVVEAAGFCNFSQDLHKGIWNKILEAEETGVPPTAPLPQAFYEIEKDQTKITVTKEEAHEIYAAHLAHSLWLEKNEIVPWSILEYDQEQLEELLKPNGTFNRWDDTKEEYTFSLLLDYSPRNTFSIANESVPSFSDQRAALNDIIKAGRALRHGISVIYDSEGNPTGDHDPMEIVTMETMHEEKISRHGCQTMSPYVIQLGKSLNIPGRFINGYYYGAGHRSALFEFTDQVLAHGDDPYSGWLDNTPSSEIMGSYEFWKNEVMSHPKGDSEGAHNSVVHNLKNAMNYPAYYLLRDYCMEGGREFLDQVLLNTTFGAFATVAEIDALEEKILQLSNNCTPPFPENNPDQ